ncbi:hypothetical protein I7I49_15365 [Sinorhizobium meliloti]|uniref:hypothetical protein n=1 Tax=Rhizobium meliloti TaxID=382 RepID=UPI00237F4C05|nr:hypothetical protein [Sinorhizobium meliloti]MDE3811654.1 hypothetical protein [Sinorhizobium meliloti]
MVKLLSLISKQFTTGPTLDPSRCDIAERAQDQPMEGLLQSGVVAIVPLSDFAFFEQRVTNQLTRQSQAEDRQVIAASGAKVTLSLRGCFGASR